MRDDFPEKTKRTLAQRVGFRCSNPICRRLTVGPTDDVRRALNIGVAAHITAASPGGPRYDPSISPQERASIRNGIWLCQNCAKLVDTEERRFTVNVLLEWKHLSEFASREEVEQYSPPEQPGLAVYCTWMVVNSPQNLGFLIQVENLENSRCSARNVRFRLAITPTGPIIGLAKPAIGEGWYEDFHLVKGAIEPSTLHPGEARPLARLMRLPGSLPDEPDSVSLDVSIFADDAAPVRGQLLIPVWTQASPLPDEFADRTLIVTNAAPLYDPSTLPSQEASVVPFPQTTEPITTSQAKVIRQLAREFEELLDSDPEEQQAQQFLKEHPIVFHFFAPAKILAQAPVLTDYRTDFAILSRNAELFLVEIERPSTKLLTASGQPAASFTHAFQQILDWLHAFEAHYAACLHGLSLLPSDVISVQGVLIAGRDAPYLTEQLQKLKWQQHGRVRFLTYDDILRGLEGLGGALEEL